MSITLEGQISIRAAIENNSRDVFALYIQRSKRHKYRRLIQLAEQHRILVNLVDQSAIRALSTGQSHGGVVAVVGERHYTPLSDLATHADNPFVVMLDGVEDPFNFGQSVRALYAAGVNGLVVRMRNWTSAATVVARASAGTSEMLPIATVNDPSDAIDHFRARGLTVICTANDDTAVDLYQADLKQPMLLIIGGEKRGIARSVLARADVQLRIAYGRAFGKSLGATVATAVIVFEAARQRQMM